MDGRSVETVVVGAGQAGLVASWFLRAQGREHVLLDRRPTLGGGWLDRWNAFRLVSPNWTLSVPGHDYAGPEPDGFAPRDEIVQHWRAYARAIDAPVELDTEVLALEPDDGGGQARFRVTTNRGPIAARSVVVAAGPFGRPNVPAIAAGLHPSILQLHAHDYRSPEQLPPGGVLLVGSGQSGVQLAEELLAAGREVTLAVGRCGRFPRRYRDRDIFWWLRQMAVRGAAVGCPLPTPDTLPDPRLRFACNPQLSGHGGGHEVYLRQMAASGLRLTGRLTGFEGLQAFFAPTLIEMLRFADAFFPERFQDDCDRLAERLGEDLPSDELRSFDFDPPEVERLDLGAERITTVLWTSGYRPDFGWLRLPVLDDLGLPRRTGGLTAVPGLSFLGTPWLVDMGSANLVGLARDAEALARTWAVA
jgi:putative flavoprotein involved in K+ transport